MNFQPFISVLIEKIKNRFELSENDTMSKEFIEIGSDYVFDKKVLRLRRFSKIEDSPVHYKTLLMADIEHKELRESLEWGALVKEILLDPETADLYLFIFWKGETKPSLEECLRIESSEDICRKFVLRDNEGIESFLERTFLSELMIVPPLDLGQDPLFAAFSELEEQFPWFDAREKDRWVAAFNSGHSGYELFDALINQKKDENETS